MRCGGSRVKFQHLGCQGNDDELKMSHICVTRPAGLYKAQPFPITSNLSVDSKTKPKQGVVAYDLIPLGHIISMGLSASAAQACSTGTQCISFFTLADIIFFSSQVLFLLFLRSLVSLWVLCMPVLGPAEARQGFRSSGDGVSGNCEPPNGDARNWTWGLCKSITCS